MSQAKAPEAALGRACARVRRWLASFVLAPRVMAVRRRLPVVPLASSATMVRPRPVFIERAPGATLARRGPLAFILLASAASAGTPAGGVYTSVYVDDDQLTVVSPSAAASIPLRSSLLLDVTYEADVISAATVDVRTAASPRGYSETRHAGSVGIAWKTRPEVTLGARLLPSFENDYRSFTGLATAAAELLDQRLTARVTGRVALEQVGRRDAAADWAPLDTFAIGADLGWVFNRRTVGELGWETSHATGFMASPYRYLRVHWDEAAGAAGPGSPGSVMVPEAVPGQRLRTAGSARLRVALTRAWFARVGYRLYADSWQVQSHTADLEVQASSADARRVAGVFARGYTQGAASFFEPEYRAPLGELPRYRAADKLLAASRSLLVGARGELAVGPWGPIHELRLTARLETYRQWFTDFAPLARRQAWIGSVGLSVQP